jgi:hypothetical protein
MDDASLQELLRAAGRSEPAPPGMPPDLAHRVRGLRDRRRRTRKALGGLLVTAVLLGGTTWVVHYALGPTETTNSSVADHTKPSDAARDSSPEDAQRLRAEIAELAAEAQRRKQAVEEMTRPQRLREQIARLESRLSQPDPLEVARIEIEKTAFLLVDHARQQSPLSSGSSPVDEYRRILEHFPGTNGARTARENLDQIEIQKGDL